MTNTIWKAALSVVDEQTITVPAGAIPLSVGEQSSEDIQLWFYCDPSAPTAQMTILICGTGHPCPDLKTVRFIGTVIWKSMGLVWHVFQKV